MGEVFTSRAAFGRLPTLVAALALLIGGPWAAAPSAAEESFGSSSPNDSGQGESEQGEEAPRLDLPQSLEDLVDHDLGPDAVPPDQLPRFDEGQLTLRSLLPDPEFIHPDLPSGIVVNVRSLGPVASDLHQARLDLLDASDRRVRDEGHQALLKVQLTALDEDVASARVTHANRTEERFAASEELGDFAISTFVDFEDHITETLAPGLDALTVTTLADESELHLRDTMKLAIDSEEAARLALDAVVAEQRLREEDLIATGARIAQADRDRVDASERIDELTPRFEDQLMLLPVSGTDIPLVVLDAYYRASETTAEENPACRVSWNQLAGIGKVESSHGSFGGNVVDRKGRTDGEILGPVLDGDPWLAIPDTDGGLHDGDVVWDRAVGPMQFIPGSWKIYGRDGNDDGEVDPHNIYDAALAAAGHLCRSASGLDDVANFRTALFGYNRSEEYGLQVMGLADSYSVAVRLSTKH